MAWTDTRVETLTTLWQAGYSGSLIGIELGLTRSAVIGKAQRLRLPGRTTLVTRRPPRSQPLLEAKRPAEAEEKLDLSSGVRPDPRPSRAAKQRRPNSVRLPKCP